MYRVKISAALILVVFLLFPYNLFAQRGGGGRRGGGGAPGGTPGSPTDQNSMKEFNHAIAVQATKDQSADFMSWAKSTETARNRTADLAREIEKANDRNGLSSHITGLRYAADEAKNAQEHFLQSFSNAQKSGLKEFTKKLEKADSAVRKELKKLGEDSGHPDINSKQIASSAEKLEQAFASLQSEQHRLGEEMGIQPPPSKTAAN
jgi:hypothetical protein